MPRDKGTSPMRRVLLILALAGLTATGAQAYPSIVQEQGGSSRPPLQRYELIIKNRASNPIVAVYVKSLRMSNWSVDQIPNYSIKPGRQGLVNLYDGGSSCEWSVRTVSSEGDEAKRTLNVCETATLTITD